MINAAKVWNHDCILINIILPVYFTWESDFMCSKNGLLINGSRLENEDSRSLKSGDELSLGLIPGNVYS